MFAAGNGILEHKRQAQGLRFTVKCGDSHGDSCSQLETAFWSKREKHRDGDSPSNVQIQVERERERESIKVLEVHGAYGALISMTGTCLI